MPARVFLFEWNKEAAAKRADELRAAGWQVDFESEDGARGGRRVLDQRPQVIVFDLAVRPSHSRATAEGIRGLRAGRYIPMLFIDGAEKDVNSVKERIAGAAFTGSADLLTRLAGFDN